MHVGFRRLCNVLVSIVEMVSLTLLTPPAMFGKIALATGNVHHAAPAPLTFQLSGKVTDQSGTPIVAAIVEVKNPTSAGIEASTSTDTNGEYAVPVIGGVYDISVTPPTNSGFRKST